MILLRLSFLFFSLLAALPQAFGVLADAGHRPFNADVPNVDGNPNPRRQFRQPYVEISNNPANNTPITVYTVVKKFNNPFGTANQTGGTLYYKGAADGVWQSVGLGFHANEGDFQYWKASFNSSSFDANEVIQYYFLLTFDSGAENTYLYAGAGFGDLASQTTNQESTAASNAFTIRNRPAWIFHANNRVANGNQVDFWAKVGYIGDPNNLNTRWATDGAVYYTTDGTDPIATSTPGQGGAGTSVALFAYSHPETNSMGSQSIAGTPMWWKASIVDLLQGLPLGATIKYRIGFWNSANNEQKFADHNAGANNTIFSFSNGAVGEPVLTVSTPTTGTLNGNYTTSKLYVDEISGSATSVTVTFEPRENDVTEVELVTNLNQRDQVTADNNSNGVDDGMEFNQTESIIGAPATFYYRSHAMASAGLGQYTAALSASKTGAYRLTARWKVQGDPNWRWYTNSQANRRDHAITVAPVDARDITLYEINTLTIEAKDTSGFIERSTFEDLFDAPNAPRTADGRGFNLDYVRGLGMNWLWFQPIHPPAVDGREIDPGTGQPYNPGSPYAVKNFFQINPWMSANYNGSGDINGTVARMQGMESFQTFVGAADTHTVGIMLDAPFNHTGLDVELAEPGVELFARDNEAVPSPATQIRDHDTRFFSKSGDYAQRAGLSANYSDIAVAPDRGDFGKWNDVRDVYFGRYDALVNTNPADNGAYSNEGDRFYYAPPGSGTANNPENVNWTSTDFIQGGQPRNVTKQVWKYFSRYAIYWLEKTRPPGQNRNSATEPGLTLAQRYAWDQRGIDGLRADFGQGLPPQLWEYIINQARSYKWNFVMMSESLDGGAVTYRSNRHFDILNENIVFPFKSAGNNPDYRGIFDGRRAAYGQGLVLLNNTSHDEENYVNIFFPLMRYQVANSVDGAPMIFMGQELGITRTSGFSFYETNFGKQIAHFKKFNSMQPAWVNRLASPFGEKFLFDAFAPAGQARQASRALRSSNRFYLNRKFDGLPRNEIWSVAKYETPTVSPTVQDVVFAFANLRTESGQSDVFDVNISSGGSNLFGIKSERTYDFKNIAAYPATNTGRRDVFLNRRTGAQLINEGLFVSLNGVPASDAGWETAPYEAQYLKLYDVTVPAAPGAPAPLNPYGYTIVGSTTLSWSPPVTDTEGLQWTYKITFLFNNQNFVVYTTATSYTFMVNAGTLSVSVQAINPNEDLDDAPPTSPPSSTAIIQVLNGAEDADGDGQTNADENVAGTNPLNPVSVLKVSEVTLPGPAQVRLVWDSVPGEVYRIEGAATPGGTYMFLGGQIPASGGLTTEATVPTTGLSFFRVSVVP